METKNKPQNSLLIIPVIIIVLLVILLIALIVLMKKDEGASNEVTSESAIEESSISDEESSSEGSSMTAEEFNELSPEERGILTEEEFYALPDDEIYIDPKDGVQEIIPGILPTKEQALSYLYQDAVYCYEVIGIFSGIPTIIDDPWQNDDGSWSCFINNELGTTVLWSTVFEDGGIDMGLYGSEFNKDFVGIMYSTSSDNPDIETTRLLEEKIIEKYGNARKLKITGYENNIVTLVDADKNETVIDLNE